MFTGIVHGCYPVVFLDRKSGLVTFSIEFPADYLEGLKIGASVAVNGTCLTVKAIDGNAVFFDAMEETLKKTNIGEVKLHDRVNVERSARFGDEIGGHVMSGHIIGTAEIVKIDQPENNYVISFRVAPELMKYIFDKGFI